MKITDVKTTVIEGRKDFNYVRIDTDEGASPASAKPIPVTGLSISFTKG